MRILGKLASLALVGTGLAIAAPVSDAQAGYYPRPAYYGYGYGPGHFRPPPPRFYAPPVYFPPPVYYAPPPRFHGPPPWARPHPHWRRW